MSVPTSDRAGIRQAIRALVKAGYTLRLVNDGEDLVPVRTETAAIDAITAVDMATLYVMDGEGKRHGVYFVMGNEPEEVICDYHASLEPVIGPLVDKWLG